MVSVGLLLQRVAGGTLESEAVACLFEFLEVIAGNVHLVSAGLGSFSDGCNTLDGVFSRDCGSLPCVLVEALGLGELPAFAGPLIIRMPEVAGIHTHPALDFLIAEELIAVRAQRITAETVLLGS